MGKKQYTRGRGEQKQLALEHIRSLFQQAEEVFREDKGLANRYVELARKIAMKMKVHMPAEYKRRFCKYCQAYLRPGVNVRIRTRKGRVVMYCQECKKVRRVGVK